MSGLRILIVERLTKNPRMARLKPAEYFPTDPADALLWADTFNRGELEHPVGVWAVVELTPTAG